MTTTNEDAGLSAWAPERIWLQNSMGDDGSHTWCSHPVGDNVTEAEYVRADLAPLDKDAGKPAAAQGWALTRQQHPADDECEAMDTILVQGPKGERHIAYDIPGVGHALYAFLDAMLAASTVAPSVEQDERGAEYGSTDFGYTFAGINLEEGDKRLMAMLVSALGTEHPAIEDLTALLFRAASTSANVAQGAENYEEFLQWFREHYRFIFSAGTERHAEKIWNAISAPPVQTALTVTPVMVKAAMPWLTGLHYMRKTDKESHVEEAIKAALTVASSSPAADTKKDDSHA